MGKLLRNRAQCLDCQDIIESKFGHDWVCCRCYSKGEETGIFVDGGTNYQRCGAYDWKKFKDLSEWEGGAEHDITKQVQGVVREIGDEWVLVTDLLPKNGDPVLVYDPEDPENPYMVAIYNEKTSQWKCAHCKKFEVRPRMWKFLSKAM